MIYTSSLKNCSTDRFEVFELSDDNSEYVDYFKPKTGFIKYIDEHKKSCSSDEYIDSVIQYYYINVLSLLDSDAWFRRLDNTVIVDGEESEKMFLRLIISEWLSIFNKCECEEAIISGDDLVTIDLGDRVRRSLLNVIYKHMNGFDSIEALKLFLRGENLYKKIEIMEAEGKDCENLRNKVVALWWQATSVNATANENEIKELMKK